MSLYMGIPINIHSKYKYFTLGILFSHARDIPTLAPLQDTAASTGECYAHQTFNRSCKLIPGLRHIPNVCGGSDRSETLKLVSGLLYSLKIVKSGLETMLPTNTSRIHHNLTDVMSILYHHLTFCFLYDYAIIYYQ